MQRRETGIKKLFTGRNFHHFNEVLYIHSVKIFHCRCWNVDASFRPLVIDVLEFSKNTGFHVSGNHRIYSYNMFPEKETVLLIGGNDGHQLLDSLIVLQNNGENEESWTQLNIKLPYPMSFHGAQFLNNQLYIFGGENEKGEASNLMYKLSRDLKWEKIKEMNEKRSHILTTSIILNDGIWVLGGWNGKETLKSVEAYSPQTNNWIGMT